eukprot:1557032-Pyramimonas_sp.AAC.1
MDPALVAVRGVGSTRKPARMMKMRVMMIMAIMMVRGRGRTTARTKLIMVRNAEKRSSYDGDAGDGA